MDSVNGRKKSVLIAVLLSLIINGAGFLYLAQYKRFISSILLTVFIWFLILLFLPFDIIIAILGTLIYFAFLLFIVYKTFKVAKEIHGGANLVDVFKFWEIRKTEQKTIEKPIYKFVAYTILAIVLLLAFSPYISLQSHQVWSKPFGLGEAYYCPDSECRGTGLGSGCSEEVMHTYCLWHNQDRAFSKGRNSNGNCLFNCGNSLDSYEEEEGITLEQVKLMADAIREKRPDDCEKLPSDPEIPNYEKPETNLDIDIGFSPFDSPFLVFDLGTPYKETCYYYYSRIRDKSVCNKMPNDFVIEKCFSFAEESYESELIEKSKTDFKDICTNCAD